MKIIPCTKSYDYTESGQSNPLRWTMLHRVDRETFQAQTAEFRCKDYFNECTALYNGHVPQSIYGFTAAGLKLNEEGVYVLLRNIAHKAHYKANIGSINKLGAAQGFPEIELMEHETGYIALIPRKYFDSTWLTSLVTYLMRVANVKETVADPTWMEHPTKNIDNPFGHDMYEKILKRGFKTPEAAKSYYFAGLTWDYTKANFPPEYVHNNGCRSWATQLQAVGQF